MSELELLSATEKGMAKLAELIEEDVPVLLFSLSVQPIQTQKDDIDPSHLKRATTKIVVEERSKKSIFKAILEFRGQTLVLSRVEGDYDMDDLAKRLRIEYVKRYRKETLKPDRILERGRIQHYIVTNLDNFLDFLHLVKTVPMEVYSQQGEHAVPQWIRWITEKSLRRQSNLDRTHYPSN